MDVAEFDKIFEVEARNWWYRGRRDLITGWLQRRHAERGPLRMLDIACAAGMSFRYFARFGEVCGVDISEETMRLCKQRGFEGVVRGDAERLPFRDHSFDVVLSLDSLEHLDDDHAAIEEIRRIAKPDALILITVPAYMFLWSPHDVAFHHKRRYTRGELGSKLKAHGLTVHKLTYYSMTALPPLFLLRKARALLSRGSAEEEVHSDFFLSLPDPIEKVLYGVMRAEIGLLRAVNLPFGVNLFCAASP